MSQEAGDEQFEKGRGGIERSNGRAEGGPDGETMASAWVSRGCGLDKRGRGGIKYVTVLGVFLIRARRGGGGGHGGAISYWK